MTTDFGTGTDDAAQAVRVQADGRIVVAGYTDAGGTNDLAVLRYPVRSRGLLARGRASKNPRRRPRARAREPEPPAVWGLW